MEWLSGLWDWVRIQENHGALGFLFTFLLAAGSGGLALIRWLRGRKKPRALDLNADQALKILSIETIAELAEHLKVSEGAVRGFLVTLHGDIAEGRDAKTLRAKLVALARSHAEMRARLQAIEPDSDEDKTILQKIISAVDEGHIDQARTLLEERGMERRRRLADAERLYRDSAASIKRQRRALSENESLLAQAALRELNVSKATEHFQAAANAYPITDVEGQAWAYINASNLLRQHGAVFGHWTSSKESIDMSRMALVALEACRFTCAWAEGHNVLGNALLQSAEATGNEATLIEAVTAYQAALEVYARNGPPAHRATVQCNMGNALRILGERNGDMSAIRDAIEAFRSALMVYSHDGRREDWAMAQNDLGNALRILGERTGDVVALEDAVSAFRDALRECSQDRSPMTWAMTQANLGGALACLGGRTGDLDILKDALGSYRESLKKYTRENAPNYWSSVQNNLGNVLRKIAEITGDIFYLEKSISAYKDAIKERSRYKAPLDWAKAQVNLGNSLQNLAEQTSDVAALLDAVAAYGKALEVFHEAGLRHYANIARQNLSRAEGTLLRLRKTVAH